MSEYRTITFKSPGYDKARLEYLEKENEQQRIVINASIWIITFLICTVIYMSGNN